MTRTKLVSDFDGIWTEQHIEAGHVWEYITNSVAELSGNTIAYTKNFLERCRKEMNKHPERYGWKFSGETAAFFNEDPYGDNNAIFDFIDKADNDFIEADIMKELSDIRNSILVKYRSLADFSQECFTIATGKFKSEGRLNPVKTTGEIVKIINSLKTDIVVVSNSTTDKIKYLFSRADIKVSSDALSERYGVHARGDARKFIIYNSDTSLPQYLEINDKIKVPLRRSNYYQILVEEKPDFVIGDVFSLDIALPLYLRMNNELFSNLKVIQRIQSYTPDWVKAFLSEKKFNNIAFTVNHVDELPEVLSYCFKNLK